jgi:ABC-type glycerol-3-phosphate transport system substrate-binding protein
MTFSVRLRFLLMALLIMLSLAACGSGESGTVSGTPANTSAITEHPSSSLVSSEKVTLTLAMIYSKEDLISVELRRNVTDYNLSNKEYRVEIIDYSKYSQGYDPAGAIEQLNLDIAAGKIPDIIVLRDSMFRFLSSKGVLADLYPFIDSDAEVGRGALLENVIEASSVNGQLHQLICSFSIYSLVGKTSNVGDSFRWTMADVKALREKFPSDAVVVNGMSKTEFITDSVILSADYYFDWKTGICRFDTPEFVELLETVKTFPEAVDYWEVYPDYDAYIPIVEDIVREDGILLDALQISNVRAARDMKESFGGEDVSFIGFPTPMGSGYALAQGLSLGISSSSVNQDGCWEFLKSVLYDERHTNDGYSLPASKNILENLLAFEMTPVKEREYEGDIGFGKMHVGGMSIGRVYKPGTFSYSEALYGDWHLTQAEANRVKEMITSAETLFVRDENIAAIISEETDPYFAGQKTAEEAAEIIQTRMSIYLSEIS